MLPTLPPRSTSPYYSHGAFNALSPVAVLYSAASQILFGLFLRATPWKLRIRGPVRKEASSLMPLDSKTSNNAKRRKVCICTGSNCGIGFETSKALVEQGYEVVLACRSRDKAMRAVDAINESGSAGGSSGRAVFVHPLDLSSFDSVRSFCDAIKERYDCVDVLINNAGLNTSGKSERGLDLLFQSNFLGHFLLTEQLMDRLLEGGGGRVVNLSSVMHHYADGWEAAPHQPHSYQYWKHIAQYNEERTQSSYTPSKLAALLFTLELNRRYGDRGLRSIAANPGAVNSDIWRNTNKWLVKLFGLIYLTSVQGCSTSVAAATQDFGKDNVEYLQPYYLPKWMKVAFPALEMLGPYVGWRITEPRLPEDGAKGLNTAAHLWKASEELAGCVFDDGK